MFIHGWAKKKILGIPAIRYQKKYQRNSSLPKAEDTHEVCFWTANIPAWWLSEASEI